MRWLTLTIRITSEQLMPMLPVVKSSDFDSALALALKVEEGLHHRYHALAERVALSEPRGPHPANLDIRQKRPSYAGIGVGGEGFTTFTIATPTGEGPRQRVLLPAPALRADQRLSFYSLTEVAMNTFSLQNAARSWEPGGAQALYQ